MIHELAHFRVNKNSNFKIAPHGSDWKNTEKWNNYEKEFSKVNVKIVYFPYTKGTSSTILNETLKKIRNV